MNERAGFTDRWSPSRLARIAGGLYLVNIVCGAFALGYVPSAAPTLGANPLLFRAGIAAHLIVVLTNPPLTLLFYEIFKVVSRRLALLSALFGLVATAIEGVSLLVQVDHPLVPAYDVYAVFFAFELATTAFLIVRSNFLPRAIGALLAVDSAAYITYSFADILAPGFASHLVPYVQLPILVAEGSLCLWLLIAGVNVRKWSELAATAPVPVPALQAGR
jgi:hypothetical protein